MTKKFNFSIIIPNYNGGDFLGDLLNSLTKAIYKVPNHKFEIILIDNGSQDNSIEIFEQTIPKNWEYKILLNKKNYGFAGAVNQGVERSKYDYVAILNNDLTMESSCFEIFSETIQKNKNQNIAAFSGTVLNKNGTNFESQGLEFLYRGKAKNISNNQKFHKSHILKQKPSLVWGASAAFIIYNKKIIKRVGLFDKDFFAYQEDVDLALRLNKLSYQTLYIPQVISYHLGGGTSNKLKNFRGKLSFRNWFFIIIKNYSLSEILGNFWQIINERLHNFSYFLKETISIYKIKSIYIIPLDTLKIFLEILFYLPKMLKKRKVIQKLVKLNNKI